MVCESASPYTERGHEGRGRDNVRNNMVRCQLLSVPRQRQGGYFGIPPTEPPRIRPSSMTQPSTSLDVILSVSKLWYSCRARVRRGCSCRCYIFDQSPHCRYPDQTSRSTQRDIRLSRKKFRGTSLLQCSQPLPVRPYRVPTPYPRSICALPLAAAGARVGTWHKLHHARTQPRLVRNRLS